MSADLITAGGDLAELLAAENAALAAFDLPRAVGMFPDKRRAADNFVAAQGMPIPPWQRDSAARMAHRLDAELYVVYVDIGVDENEPNQRSLAANIRFAEGVGAQVVRLKSEPVAEAVAEFVREKHITQVVFGRSAVKGWKRYLYLNTIHKFLRDAPPVDVHIVTQQSE